MIYGWMNIFLTECMNTENLVVFRGTWAHSHSADKAGYTSANET